MVKRKNATEPVAFLSAQAFDTWVNRHDLQTTQVARMFGVTASTVWRWRKEGAPKLVYWACKAYDSGNRPPWLKDDLKPPMKANDGRKGNVPPQLRAKAEPPRNIQAAAPEWPVDAIYDE